jgi:GntR family transcriptional regulator
MAVRLDRDSGVPLHVQIRERIRLGVAQGTWVVGDTLPSEDELCSRLGVSRGTVRQALGRLTQEGLLVRHRHKGTVVARGVESQGLIFVSPYRAIQAAGMQPSVSVLVQAEQPIPRRVAAAWRRRGAAVRRQLSPVIYFDRVFSANGEPIARASSWVPASRFERLLKMDLTGRAFLDILAHEFGVVITRVEERMELTTMAPADASLLGSRPGTPCLAMSVVQWSGDEPVEYAEFWLDPDKSRFLITGLLAVGHPPGA